MVRVTRHTSYNHSTRQPCFLRNATQALEQPGSSLGSKQDAKPSLNNPSEPPLLHALPPPPLRILLSSSGQETPRSTQAATVTITATQQRCSAKSRRLTAQRHIKTQKICWTRVARSRRAYLCCQRSSARPELPLRFPSLFLPRCM